MTAIRKLGLVFLSVILIVSLALTSAAVTVDRTAMSADFAAETAADADVHEAIGDQAREIMKAEAPDEPAVWPLDRTTDDIIEDAFLEHHVREQLDPTIHSIYAFMHGEADTLDLRFDVGPLIDDITRDIETDLEETGIAEYGIPEAETVGAMHEDPAAFEAEQTEFREEQKQEIQEDTDAELTDEQLEAEYDDRVDEIRADYQEDIDEEIDDELGEDEISRSIEEPVRDITHAYVDARVGLIGFDEYSQRLDTGQADLDAAILEGIESEIDAEVGHHVDLTEEMDDDTMAQAETAQEYIALFGLLVYGLIGLSLLVAGLMVLVAPSATAAVAIGISAAIAGLLGVGGVTLADGTVQGMIEDAMADAGAPAVVERLLLSLVDGILAAWQFHSLLLVAIGAAAIASGVAIHRGIRLDNVRDRIPWLSASEEPPTDGAESPSDDERP